MHIFCSSRSSVASPPVAMWPILRKERKPFVESGTINTEVHSLLWAASAQHNSWHLNSEWSQVHFHFPAPDWCEWPAQQLSSPALSLNLFTPSNLTSSSSVRLLVAARCGVSQISHPDQQNLTVLITITSRGAEQSKHLLWSVTHHRQLNLVRVMPGSCGQIEEESKYLRK